MTYIPSRQTVNKDTEFIDCEPNEMFCPYCGIEQIEHPRNIFQMNEFHTECDECGETINLTEIYFLRCSK